MANFAVSLTLNHMPPSGNDYISLMRHRYGILLRAIRRHRDLKEPAMLKQAFSLMLESFRDKKDITGSYVVDSAMKIASIALSEIGLGVTSITGIFLYPVVREKALLLPDIQKQWGSQVTRIVSGLNSIQRLDSQDFASQAENFRSLLLNLAGDVRVILIRLTERLYLMRNMKILPQDKQIVLAAEASYLYAPLAHRLGLYLIKSEMEDISLKYTNRNTYDLIARKLAETMRSRRQFIHNFIKPIQESLKMQGFDFEIHGRPKSIYSIWNKMQKKNTDFENIYDLFAIRIILNSEQRNEKADCWQVYSTVTDIYQPNPLRLRDWISVPKTNGYESLHTTVVGPGGRWVEVQIRTRRMNEIAEKGLAAHWKYKGADREKSIDDWLAKVREVLEAPESDAKEFLDDFKLSLYAKEIFVFTPKGDLRKFPSGATVLDFAYDIHTQLGSTCVGAKVNGKNVSIRHVLRNGDRVEILSSKNQNPKIDWLGIVVTSKAKTKIRFKLNEEKVKIAENGKEILQRRLKNWKIPFSDENVRKLMKHYKLKIAQDLYYMISTDKIDMAGIKEFLTEPEQPEVQEEKPGIEAEKAPVQDIEKALKSDDYLIIDDKVAHVDYKLARCCNPIFGDEIFGFVTVGEGIKIHRLNCPNAVQLISRYGYRVVKARWKATGTDALFPVEIAMEGEHDPAILNNISNVLAKDLKINLQSISIDNADGIFTGRLKITVKDTKHLDSLLARLSTIKGVYHVTRLQSINAKES
ncbi:MAG: bifunctional (p)ppGpp synthetase/guanosine-3',5'-bis(diphosphate) 3'-pyrophosphohydrolase [Bacteroidales bacterium]|nr:bifunctional (p)ppGpp synthetase/guanosine-3',5'-bis(diphosphate) 3'-pyrophosphohydrolase [Bacteroidales bacterium]